MSSDHGVEPRLSARGSATRGGSGPMYRLAAMAAHALHFSDGSVSLLRDTARHVVAATRSGSGLRRSTVAALDDTVVDRQELVVVEDLSACTDATLPVTKQHGPGAYLGVPLVDADGKLIGVLSVSGTTARVIDDAQVNLLMDVAHVVSDQLDLLRKVTDLDAGRDRATADLARAVANGEIIPWYQPIVDLATGEVKGLEALARWRRPSGEYVNPAFFIPLAERTDMIVQLDRAVIRRALVDLHRWQSRLPALRLSVNLSGRHMDQPDWVNSIRTLVDRAGVSPVTVDLELTETVRPTRSEAGREMLREVRALGFKVWFDDFGSGWSALQDLIQMPVDGIKIDRSFANDLGTPVDDAIIRALTSASAELGLKVTIEGIERARQAERATELGCHFAQGYLWSAAVPAEKLEAMMPESGVVWQAVPAAPAP